MFGVPCKTRVYRWGVSDEPWIEVHEGVSLRDAREAVERLLAREGEAKRTDADWLDGLGIQPI